MSGFLSAAGRVDFRLAYEISPLILTGGVAANTFGGMLAVVSITEAFNLSGLIAGGASLDNFAVHYVPVPGGTLINNAIGNYPFANQQVAANAIIQQPLSISLLMICPINQPAGYALKLATITTLQNTLAQHNAAGGTYTVATPAYIYTNCVMTGMTDVSNGESKQPQMMWQLDFVQPLITVQQAQQSFNSLMGKISNGTPVTGSSWSGPSVVSGTLQSGLTNPASGLQGAFASTAPIPVTSSPLGPP